MLRYILTLSHAFGVSFTFEIYRSKYHIDNHDCHCLQYIQPVILAKSEILPINLKFNSVFVTSHNHKLILSPYSQHVI